MHGFAAVCNRWGFRLDNLGSAFIGPSIFSLVSLILMIILCFATGRKVRFTGNLLIFVLLYPFWGTVQQFLILAMWTGNLSYVITGSRHTTVFDLALETIFTAPFSPHDDDDSPSNPRSHHPLVLEEDSSLDLEEKLEMQALGTSAAATRPVILNTSEDEEEEPAVGDDTLEERKTKAQLGPITIITRWCLLVVVMLCNAAIFSAVHYPHQWLMLATFLLGLPWSLFYLKQRNLFPLGLYHGVVGSCFYFWWLQQDPLS